MRRKDAACLTVGLKVSSIGEGPCPSPLVDPGSSALALLFFSLLLSAEKSRESHITLDNAVIF